MFVTWFIYSRVYIECLVNPKLLTCASFAFPKEGILEGYSEHEATERSRGCAGLRPGWNRHRAAAGTGQRFSPCAALPLFLAVGQLLLLGQKDSCQFVTLDWPTDMLCLLTVLLKIDLSY